MAETKAEVKAQAEEAPAEVKAEVTEPVPLGGQQTFKTVTPDEAKERRLAVKDAHTDIIKDMLKACDKMEKGVEGSMTNTAMTIRNRAQTIRLDMQHILRDHSDFK